MALNTLDDKFSESIREMVFVNKLFLGLQTLSVWIAAGILCTLIFEYVAACKIMEAKSAQEIFSNPQK